MIRYVIFLGKPGSGKGTQAQYFSRFGWIHLSTGELFRRHLQEKTVLGSEVEQFVKKGDLVPDDVTFSLVEDFLTKAKPDSRIIFDGFPRSENQARLLEDWTEKTRALLVAAVEFFLPDDEAVRRLLNRYYCPTCGYVSNEPGLCPNDGSSLVKRTDDSEEVVRKRLADYESYAPQLRTFYRRKGKYLAIDATKKPSQISKFLESVMLRNDL
ncbi:MAG TPA: nucleoside monophosphate kinase [Coprothermobacter proteolyticus]|nr:nucleoside monophosphate kinase [Coprothermobacter proteolyticus]